VEAHLWRTAFSANHAGVRINMVSGAQAIFADPECGTGLTLPFAGRVSIDAPQKGVSFTLAHISAGNITFDIHMHGTGLTSVTSRDCFVPAWLVTSVDEPGLANMTVEYETDSITLSEGDLGLLWDDDTGRAAATDEITLRFRRPVLKWKLDAPPALATQLSVHFAANAPRKGKGKGKSKPTAKQVDTIFDLFGPAACLAETESADPSSLNLEQKRAAAAAKRDKKCVLHLLR
jgi:hypothetical protein